MWEAGGRQVGVSCDPGAASVQVGARGRVRVNVRSGWARGVLSGMAGLAGVAEADAGLGRLRRLGRTVPYAWRPRAGQHKAGQEGQADQYGAHEVT